MQNPHDPFNGWQQTPGAHHDPFNKWPQTPPGAHLGSQDGSYGQAQSYTKSWVPPYQQYPTPVYPDAPVVKKSGCGKAFVIGCVIIAVLIAITSVVVLAYQSYLKNINKAYDSVQKGITSTWSGDELQYNRDGYTGTGHTDMILTIGSIKKGSLHGQVHWPDMGDTVTRAEGTIAAKVNHKDIHWKYVETCSGKGIYLQFTETEYIKGNSVLLNATYYAVVCDGTLGGVWFWPDRSNGAPGGEFSLQWKSPPVDEAYNSVPNEDYNSVQKPITSTWEGGEFQYNLVNSAYGHTKMILTIESIKKGSIHGQVYWPGINGNVTKIEGDIVTNVNHKDIHWLHVYTCSSKGIYLQFTETQFIKGNSVELHSKYFAVVCDGTMSGVWFYPDHPNDAPGGEFSLQ